MTYIIDKEGKVADAWYGVAIGRAEKVSKETRI